MSILLSKSESECRIVSNCICSGVCTKPSLLLRTLAWLFVSSKLPRLIMLSICDCCLISL